MVSSFSKNPAGPSSGLPMPIPSENPHPESDLEWWFAHGRYGDDHGSSRTFMVSLFRHRTSPEEGRSEDAFSLLVSVLNPETGRQATASQIDPLLRDAVVRNRPRMESLGLDPDVLDAWLRELQEKGPLKGVRLNYQERNLSSDPLEFQWGDFQLSQDEDCFTLRFTEPGTERHCILDLHPVAPRMSVDAARDIGGESDGMFYHSYPRLRITGSVNGIAVSGDAWLDHQWGDYSWITGPVSAERLTGWDWFGINFDDGADWILIRRRNVTTDEVESQHLTIRDQSGTCRSIHDFIAEPLRHWESPGTTIRHPVEWRIQVPELDATLRFSPSVDDQEIRVFGIMRAIWEGAGTIIGTVGDNPVRGRARGEFQGYGYVLDIHHHLAALGARIDRHIETFLPKAMDDERLAGYLGPPTWKYEPAAYTRMLSEPVWDLVSRGGKRWRPIFGLLLLDALGGDRERFEALVASLGELGHTGSLIVDDIQDSASTRRGEECIHLRYGEGTAINSANTLYFMPSLLLFDHPHVSADQRLEIHEAVLRQQVRCHFGQALDLYWGASLDAERLSEWLNDSAEPKILQMYELKTGSPVVATVTAAAILAGADSATREKCENFARALGVAFQVVDDVLDFRCPDNGKACSADLAEGKFTYVVCRAFRVLDDLPRSHLQKVLCTETLRSDPARIEEASEIIKQSGVLESCRDEAVRLVKPEWERLRETLEPSESKLMLELLYRRLVNLDVGSG